MSDLFAMSVTGRLTKDAEEKVSVNGKRYIQMDVAINTGFGDNKKVSYIKINKWGESTRKLLIYLTKGTQISASGEVYIEKNTSQETGKEFTNIILTANMFNFFSTAENSANGDEIANDKVPF